MHRRLVLSSLLLVAAACQEQPRVPAPSVSSVSSVPTPATVALPAPIVATPPASAVDTSAASDTATPWSVITHPSDAAGRMIFPAVLEDGCSQEDCDFDLKAIACEPIELRAATADNAAVVHRIMRKDSLTVDSTRIVLTRPGVVVVRRRLDVEATRIGESRGGTHHFAAGDTLLLIEGYENDVGGEWQWWRHGHVETGMRFWPEPESADTASAAAILLARPVYETWLRITPSRGTAGWWRLQQRDRAAFEPANRTGADRDSCLG